MRFICVNLRGVSIEQSYCVFCHTSLGKSYVRDLTTRALYHSHYCLNLHEEQSVSDIQNAARLVP